MPNLLSVTAVSAGYGEALVLRDVSFALEQGQAMALLGRNGTGKTTLINTLMGLTRQRGGGITLAGAEITQSCGLNGAHWPDWAGCRRSATSSNH